MKKRTTVIRCFVLLVLIATFAACATTPKSTWVYVDDSVITANVKSLLSADDLLKSFQISVETHEGVVQLSGVVNSQQAVNKAILITSDVKGIKSIKNELTVK